MSKFGFFKPEIDQSFEFKVETRVFYIKIWTFGSFDYLNDEIRSKNVRY